jgi:hypothetical protein
MVERARKAGFQVLAFNWFFGAPPYHRLEAGAQSR